MFEGILKLFGGGFVKDVGDAIDNIVTSDEERLQLRNEFQRLMNKAQEQANELAAKVEENLTRRHEADMQSDSWLAKNIRPITLIALTVFTMGYVASGQMMDFVTAYEKEIYIAGLQMLSALDALAFGFYFGSRGIEKSVTKVATMLLEKKNG